MRRGFVLLMIISLLLGLCGCSTKNISVEQSERNFETYKESLQNVVNRYGYELKETSDNIHGNNRTIQDICIEINTGEIIYIRMVNSSCNGSKGSESFSVDYVISRAVTKEPFNLNLFVELTNCVSGKTISVELCDEFINAPESKYAAEKSGFKKLNGEIIAKYLPLNFFEDWTISYVLSEHEEILTFGGLTMQIGDEGTFSCLQLK